MRYFIKTSGTDYVPKNKLVTEIRKQLQPLDRSIIENFDELVEFNRWIDQQVSWCHKRHPRCKPLEIKFEPFMSLKTDNTSSAFYYFQECHVIKITIYQENQSSPFFKGHKI